jgi:hypothetical protein
MMTKITIQAPWLDNPISIESSDPSRSTEVVDTVVVATIGAMILAGCVAMKIDKAKHKRYWKGSNRI